MEWNTWKDSIPECILLSQDLNRPKTHSCSSLDLVGRYLQSDIWLSSGDLLEILAFGNVYTSSLGSHQLGQKRVSRCMPTSACHPITQEFLPMCSAFWTSEILSRPSRVCTHGTLFDEGEGRCSWPSLSQCQAHQMTIRQAENKGGVARHKFVCLCSTRGITYLSEALMFHWIISLDQELCHAPKLAMYTSCLLIRPFPPAVSKRWTLKLVHNRRYDQVVWSKVVSFHPDLQWVISIPLPAKAFWSRLCCAIVNWSQCDCET